MEGLKRPGYPKPYFISYLVRDSSSVVLNAQYGALFSNEEKQKRNCYADVRVGSYKYDQVMQGGLKDHNENADSNDLVDLPMHSAGDALKYSLWRLTEMKYREALDAYHKKKSRDISYVDQNSKLPAFIKMTPYKFQEKQKNEQLPDLGYFEELIKKASLLFKEHLDVHQSSVEFSAVHQTKIFTSSEGVESVWHQKIYSIVVYYWWQNKKSDFDGSIVYHCKSPNELPDLKRLKKDIRDRINTCYNIDSGKSMNSYSGPVLLSAKAAGLLFHEVLGHRLEGSRLLSDEEGRTFADKVGKVVTHKDLSVYDDPSQTIFGDQSLVGSYAVDDEGVRSSKANLIEKGKLTGFLSTRCPIQKKQKNSNGHARNQNNERPISRMGSLFITSQRGHDWQVLKQKLIDLLKEKKRPFGMILLDVEGGETGTEAYDFQAFLGEVTIAKRIYVDGREEYVRGVDFVGTPLASLSQIVEVGSQLEVDNGFCGAESGLIPVSTIAPPILIENMELQAKDSSRALPPLLPLPWSVKKRK